MNQGAECSCSRASVEPAGAKAPVAQAESAAKVAKEDVGAALPRPSLDRSGLSRGVSSSAGVITAAWAAELSPTSLPRNLALVYYEEVWLLQCLMALLQLPQRACGGAQGLGRESC